VSVGVCARCRCLSFGACQNLWACRRRQTWRRSLHKQKGRGVTQSRPGGAGKAVARRDAGRGKGGGAARAAARASARVARAGREREGRARAGRGGGRAQRRGAPALELGGGRGSWPLERLQPNLEEPPRSQRRARDEKVNFFSPDFFSLSVSCCAACSPARVTRTRGRGHPTVLN